MPQQVVIVVGLVLAAGIGWVAWRAERNRCEALRAWAQERGGTFHAGDDRELPRAFPDLAPLQRGRARRARHVIRGEHRGFPFTAFDYRYVTGHGRNRRTHQLSAVVLRCSHPLIPLRIRRENIFDRVGEFLGFDDIDFESAEFSRRYHVSSPDRKWAYDVLHARTIEFLLAEGFCDLVFDGWHVLAYQGRRFAPGEFTAALELAAGTLARIPDYAVRQLTAGAEPVGDHDH